MSQYNKTVRMLFGVIAFLLFSKVSIMLGTTGWKDVCFLIGCYLFLYFLFSPLSIQLSEKYHHSIKNIIKKISKNHFLKILLETET